MSKSTSPVALVTGGTTGIGLAAAQHLQRAGYAVVATGTNETNLAAARTKLGERAVVLRADARSVADAASVAREIEQRFGRLDVLFLNAGVARFAPLEAYDEAFYDDILDVNVKGVLFQLKSVLPLLREGASVVLNTSVVAHKGMAGTSAYAASKGALSALVRALAVELAPKRIRVNGVSPGPIETPIYDKLGLPADALAGLRSGMTTKVPLARFGQADEVADVVTFLAGAGSAYLTGVELSVDGGLAAT